MLNARLGSDTAPSYTSERSIANVSILIGFAGMCGNLTYIRATIALIISVPLMTIYNQKRLSSHPIDLRIFALKNY